jgi:shikimate kinase
MGAGKSSVGQFLAGLLEREFVDSDAQVEKIAGRSIAEIFEHKGEEYFRELEKDVIREISSVTDHVVALGGGAPLDDQNWNLIKNSGCLIYLQANPKVLTERLRHEIEMRPLLGADQDLEHFLREILNDRKGRYLQADITVDTDDGSPEQIAAILRERLSDENALCKTNS